MHAVLRIAAFAVLALTVGCDSQATRVGSEEADDQVLGAELESCTSARDCRSGLRCRAHQCRSDATSVVGEVHAARGRRALGEQRYEDAILGFGEATKAYEQAKVEVPAEIYCGHGEALIRAGGDPQRFELAARVLHRCLKGAPVGVETRQHALGLFAELTGHGLDVQLLGRDKLADRYLTGQPAAPPVDELTLTVTPSEEVRSHTFTKWMERARSDEVRDALLPCWKEYFAASRQAELKVALPMRHSFKLDQYGDFGRTTLEVTDLDSTGDAAMDAARTCAKSAIDPIAEAHTKGRQDERRWDVELTFMLAPAS